MLCEYSFKIQQSYAIGSDSCCIRSPLQNQVTSLVIDQGKELDKIHYIDHPTIQFNKQESVEMPFRYVVDEATQAPTMPSGMKELLYEDMNKGFDL